MNEHLVRLHNKTLPMSKLNPSGKCISTRFMPSQSAEEGSLLMNKSVPRWKNGDSIAKMKELPDSSNPGQLASGAAKS